MGGLIHHLLAAAISLIFVYIFTKRKDYSLSIFIGNLLPDVVGAGYAAILIRSLNPVAILHSAPWFSFEKSVFITSFWMILQVIFVGAYLFYHVYLRKKEVHKEFEANLGFLLAGFVTHMIMDLLIIEKGFLY
ncbi:MAG: hypothetical protein HYW23_02990 [Candidatus Aenigmarchaeota archaeon]|nr:hypothetical protein [Candidatus Aenigmarchaeota archaeon]